MKKPKETKKDNRLLVSFKLTVEDANKLRALIAKAPSWAKVRGAHNHFCREVVSNHLSTTK